MAPTPDQELPKYKDLRLEFEARDLSVMDRISKRMDPKQQGVLLSMVTPGGWAQVGRLRTGDVVLAINGRSVLAIKDLRRVLNEMEKKKPRFLVFKVLRDGRQNHFAEIEPDWSRTE